MQQRQPSRTTPHIKRTRQFTASEVASYEYCPLVWWHEQYEPLAQADTEELFARLVELEGEHGMQATALPEYQAVEQLLLRRGAFDEGQQQHLEHAEAVAGVQEERITTSHTVSSVRRLATIVVVILLVSLLLIAAAILLRL
jgi:hypothetical protein